MPDIILSAPCLVAGIAPSESTQLPADASCPTILDRYASVLQEIFQFRWKWGREGQGSRHCGDAETAEPRRAENFSEEKRLPLPACAANLARRAVKRVSHDRMPQ